MAKKIGALWLKATQQGETFYSGVIRDVRGDIPIAVFKNNRKSKETQPDFNIVLGESRRENPPGGEADAEDIPEEIGI